MYRVIEILAGEYVTQKETHPSMASAVTAAARLAGVTPQTVRRRIATANLGGGYQVCRGGDTEVWIERIKPRRQIMD